MQPSTAIANQQPGHLVSTQIRTIRAYCFKFIIVLIVPSTKIVYINSWVTVWFFASYIIRHALLEQSPLKFRSLITSGAYGHIFSLHATGPQYYSAPHIKLKLLSTQYMKPWFGIAGCSYMASKLIDVLLVLSHQLILETITIAIMCISLTRDCLLLVV